MATTSATETLAAAPPAETVSLLTQIRMFVWLSSGMFSASALALAFLGYFLLGGTETAGTQFIAAVVSGGLFGLATILKLGPDEA